MTSKSEYVNLETVKDTDLCKIRNFAQAFKWDETNIEEKNVLINEYARKLVFSKDEFGEGLHYTRAHVVKDLAIRTNLTETEKLVILITVEGMVNAVVTSREVMATLTGAK